jgi:hypothetical protein
MAHPRSQPSSCLPSWESEISHRVDHFSLVHCRSEKCDLPPHSHTPSLISAWVMATRTVTLGHFMRPVLTPIQPLFNGYGASFPGVKTAGAWKTIKPMYCRYV